MSLLIQIQSQTEAKEIVTTIFRSIVTRHADILSEWQKSIDYVWDRPGLTPTILAEMGTSGAYMFSTSNLTYQYLEALSPGCCDDRLAKVRPYLINPDGSVVLV